MYQMIIAAIVATIISMILGMVWHNPNVFGKLWMKLANIKQDKNMKKEATKSMILCALVTLLSSIIFYALLQLSNATAPTEVLAISFLIWLGFIAPVQYGQVLWERRNIKLFLFNTCYQLVNILVMGLALSFFM